MPSTLSKRTGDPMKLNLKRVLVFTVAFFLLTLPYQNIQARSNDHYSSLILNEGSQLEGVPDYGECAEGDFNCMSDRNDSIQTADFITQSFMSLDANTAEQELDQDYIRYYWNSSVTLMGDYLDFFRPSTIIMSVVNLVTTLFEMIGLVITTFVMILYNITSTSFISSIMNTILNTLDQFVFQWDNPDSWAYKIIIIGAFVSFAIKLLSGKQKILSPSHYFNLLFQVVVSATIIIGVGIYGRPVVNYVDKMFNDLIVVVFNDESELPLEVENKRILFDTLQMQSFKIRHFGSLAIDDASYEDDEGEMVYVSADERLDTLLQEQTWENAWTEYDSYGNTAITHNIGSSFQVFFLSIIFLLHRIMLALIYITLCALLGIVKLLKELTIVLSLYQLIYLLFKGESNHRRWFMDRLQWMIVCMLGNVLFTMLLFFMSRMIENISMIHPLALIGFDILLLLIIKFAPQFISPMMKSMMSTMSPQLISEVVTGRSSPRDVYRNLERNLQHGKDGSESDYEEPKAPGSQIPTPAPNEQELADHALDQYEEDPGKQLNDTFRNLPEATSLSEPKNSEQSTKEPESLPTNKIPSVDDKGLGSQDIPEKQAEEPKVEEVKNPIDDTINTQDLNDSKEHFDAGKELEKDTDSSINQSPSAEDSENSQLSEKIDNTNKDTNQTNSDDDLADRPTNNADTNIPQEKNKEDNLASSKDQDDLSDHAPAPVKEEDTMSEPSDTNQEGLDDLHEPKSIDATEEELSTKESFDDKEEIESSVNEFHDDNQTISDTDNPDIIPVFEEVSNSKPVIDIQQADESIKKEEAVQSQEIDYEDN